MASGTEERRTGWPLRWLQQSEHQEKSKGFPGLSEKKTECNGYKEIKIQMKVLI